MKSVVRIYIQGKTIFIVSVLCGGSLPVSIDILQIRRQNVAHELSLDFH